LLSKVDRTRKASGKIIRESELEKPQMRPLDFVLLVGYAVALSMGQLLFKLAAPATKVPGFAAAIRGLLMSPAFVGGALLYAALMFYWTWLLGRVPLNYAYPIVALCFVLVPLMSWLVFGERAGAMYFVGLLFIVIGVAIIGFASSL
jgi:drug/metabolite transporter (DMT)-like permease